MNTYFSLENIEEHLTGAYHRNDDFVLLRIYEGEGSLEVDSDFYPFQHNKIYLLGPGTMHRITQQQTPLKGFRLSFSIDFIRFSGNEFDAELFGLFTYLDEEPSILLDDLKNESLEKIFSLIHEEADAVPVNLIIIKSLLHVLLAKLINFKQSPLIEPSLNKKRVLDFLHLVQSHYATERRVEFYASCLNICTKRLNQILQKSIGKTATQLLHMVLVLEAKRYLIQGKYSVKEVAHILGFEDRAYFSRFFKRNTGISPEYFKEKFIAPIFPEANRMSF